MNLRLDESDIRIRVSLEEARSLSRCHHLSQVFAFPEQGLRLEAIRVSEGTLELRRKDDHCLELRVPGHELETLLESISEGGATALDPVIRGSAHAFQRDVSLCFEIDRFTLRGRDQRSRGR